MSYDFNEHKHRFAVWTAARAVQRAFTTTDNIVQAINATSLRAFSEKKDAVSQHEFDEMHRKWCKDIIALFGDKNITCSYGRAAKIVAIYLKTSVILPTGGKGGKSSVIHSPIDSILLNALSQMDDLKDLRKKRWTNFTEQDYWDVSRKLREKVNCFNWKLEELWRPEIEDIITQ
jgi:hypothetical protein